jgi:hypothetical protein
MNDTSEKDFLALGCDSVVEHLPSIFKPLCSMISNGEKKKTGRRVKFVKQTPNHPL